MDKTEDETVEKTREMKKAKFDFESCVKLNDEIV